MSGLSELERQVIDLRFFKDMKQKQIGDQLGYSQIHISRVQRRALRQMRQQLNT